MELIYLLPWGGITFAGTNCKTTTLVDMK